MEKEKGSSGTIVSKEKSTVAQLPAGSIRGRTDRLWEVLYDHVRESTVVHRVANCVRHFPLSFWFPQTRNEELETPIQEECHMPREICTWTHLACHHLEK